MEKKRKAMLAMCTERYFNKGRNKVIGYKLRDAKGNTVEVKPEEIKKVIKSGKLNVLNLTLTSDNRLIWNTDPYKAYMKATQGDKKTSQKKQHTNSHNWKIEITEKNVNSEFGNQSILIPEWKIMDKRAFLPRDTYVKISIDNKMYDAYIDNVVPGLITILNDDVDLTKLSFGWNEFVHVPMDHHGGWSEWHPTPWYLYWYADKKILRIDNK